MKTLSTIPANLRQEVFQFLIGKMKTNRGWCGGITSTLFQFLIGKMKTMVIGYELLHSSWFQFLIGKMKTLHLKRSVPTSMCFNSL